jgi:uncharacterized phage protein gp47/JayE
MGRSFNDLYNEARSRILSETNITNLNPGSIARVLLQVYTSQTAELYNYVDQRILDLSVSSATGSNLDEIGKLVGVSRGGIQFAQTTVRFFIDPNLGLSFQDVLNLINQRTSGSATNITIPAGTTIKAGDRSYTTVSDVTLQQGIVEASTTAISSLAGSYGNANSGAIDTIVWPDQILSILQGIVLVTNDEAIESGNDSLQDEDYRFFITNAVVASAKANETAIRLAALSVPGVADITIQNYAYGIGTFAVYVTSSSPIVTQGTLQAVQAAISATQAQGIRGVAVSPTLIGVQINIALTFLPTTRAADQNSITLNAQKAAIDYVNNLKAGEELVINELIQRVMDVSDLIHDSEIVAMSVGDYARTTGLLSNVDKSIAISNIKPTIMEKLVTNTVLTTTCHI